MGEVEGVGEGGVEVEVGRVIHSSISGMNTPA